MQPEEDWDRDLLLDPAWEKQQRKVSSLPSPPQPPGSTSSTRAPGSRLRTGSRLAQAGAGDARLLRGGVLGYRRGRKGESPFPRARERRARARGGGAAGGQVALGFAIQATRLQLHGPRVGRGWEAVLGSLGLSCWLLAPDRFSPFPSPPPGRLSIWRAVAARFLGRPGLGTCGGRGSRDSAPSKPSPQAGWKAGAPGIGSHLWVCLEVWTCWNGAGAEKTRGQKPVPQPALWGRGQDGKPFYCLTQLRADTGLRLRPAPPTPLIPGRRRIWAT